jgi:hypothetical protein
VLALVKSNHSAASSVIPVRRRVSATSSVAPFSTLMPVLTTIALWALHERVNQFGVAVTIIRFSFVVVT